MTKATKAKPNIKQEDQPKKDDLPAVDFEQIEDTGKPAPTQDQLKIITIAANEQLNLLRAKADTEAVLDKINLALKVNMETTLPNSLSEAGVDSITLKGGYVVKKDMFFATSITEATKEEAFEFLVKTKNEDIIKRQIQILFSRGQEKWAKKFLRDCERRKDPLNIKLKEFVEPQTLKALVRRRREEFADQGENPDEAVPKAAFNLFTQQTAVVISPKEKAKI